MIGTTAETEVLGFAREILAARSDQPLTVIARPECDNRNDEAVEELWDGPSRRFAVEHTRVESFSGQIANNARIERLLQPVKEKLTGGLPGYFLLAVRESETSAARVKFAAAHAEVERLITESAHLVGVGETVTLRSERLPFEMQLTLRHKNKSALILYSEIEGDPKLLRAERFRKAFDKKCPKLSTWARTDRSSVLVLECDDDQNASYISSFEAIHTLLAEGIHRPDIIIYVETDITPWNAYVFKDGNRLGNDAMRNRGGGCLYERGRVR
jgi:hypothetical protein